MDAGNGQAETAQPIIESMSRTHDVVRLSGLASRFAAFVAERHPFALPYAVEAFEGSGLTGIKARDAVTSWGRELRINALTNVVIKLKCARRARFIPSFAQFDVETAVPQN